MLFRSTMDSIRAWLTKAGFALISCMAMGSTPDDIRRASAAHVNLVVSSCGIATAELLRKRFGTPWVAGVPVGEKFPAVLASALAAAAGSGECALPCAQRDATASGKRLAIPGETVFSGSLARAVELDAGVPCRVLCPLEAEDRLLANGDLRIFGERRSIRRGRRPDVCASLPAGRALLPASARGVLRQMLPQGVPEPDRPFPSLEALIC